MVDRRLVDIAIGELARNHEQFQAVHEKGHCVLLAGPGSGKTKTLTTAMARALLEDVTEPRGIACITYNNECALELESRLLKLGVTSSDQVFIGTVHSFALSQVIAPYARCGFQELPAVFRVATKDEALALKDDAYKLVIGDSGNAKDRWRFADQKRRRDVDRTREAWRGKNPELADLVEAYEALLRRQGLLDFDDMPLIAFRMIQAHSWIRNALLARFPILFIDEYQDLGQALHALVLMLCFEAGIRLFAVGDADQSIYGFLGATPELLTAVAARSDVRTLQLRLNYRSGRKIVHASMAALGEERDYEAANSAVDGEITFRSVDGNLDAQAAYVAEILIPKILGRGIPLDQIAILYRNAQQGDAIATASLTARLPIVRADSNALVRRSSRLSRLVEASARWVTGGWKDGDPLFQRLANESVNLIFGSDATPDEQRTVAFELAEFLHDSIDKYEDTNQWLRDLQAQLIRPWRGRARTVTDDDEWDTIIEMIAKTDPASEDDLPLTHFGGRVEGSGRLNLSTLHSAKGREFDTVVLFAMNNDVIPNWAEQKYPDQMREARRQFYVGVTRARRHIYAVFQKGAPSSFLSELYKRAS